MGIVGEEAVNPKAYAKALKRIEILEKQNKALLERVAELEEEIGIVDEDDLGLGLGPDTAKVKLADFSEFPAGRYREDGKSSAEQWRDEHLIPALRENERIVVEMDGVMGIGSSFMEEAFGGILRHSEFTEADLAAKMRLRTDFKDVDERAWRFISNQEARNTDKDGNI